MTAILGISAFYHDSAAALVVGRRDRRRRPGGAVHPEKHDARFPAGDRLLPARGGADAAQLDYVAFYDKPLTKFERLLETYCAYAPAGSAASPGHAAVAQGEAVHAPRDPPGVLADTVKAPLVFTDHHESHAASAFFPSPFDEAAILTLDGVGEWSTATFGDRVRATRFA